MVLCLGEEGDEILRYTQDDNWSVAGRFSHFMQSAHLVMQNAHLVMQNAYLVMQNAYLVMQNAYLVMQSEAKHLAARVGLEE